ncbi:hypothetical protein H6503_02540 [Candidatus Woesearchaeota archaeon]|nr:hypothetical protein [Candidatus Woesearchaeota archaeon]
MKAAIVTLADRKYVRAAKALFSSIFQNSGWKGDYILMSESIPDDRLDAFKKKGIKIYQCKCPYHKRWYYWPKTIFNKFLLFDDYFKQWDIIIFLDSDMIVNGTLDHLLATDYFAAVSDFDHPISHQCIHRNRPEYKELKKKYDMTKMSFNVGAMVINNKSISNKAKKELLGMFDKFKKVAFFPEQLIFNLYFYNKWKKLSFSYNYPLVTSPSIRLSFKPQFIPDATVYHLLTTPKPWIKGGMHNTMWKKYFNLFDEIDLKNRPCGRNVHYQQTLDLCNDIRMAISFDGYLFMLCWPFVKLRELPFIIDRCIGKLGRYIKKKNPQIYYFLRRIKSSIF